MLDQRSKSICLRVSEAEYKEMQKAVGERCLDGVSELIRFAMYDVLDNSPERPLPDRDRALRTRRSALNRKTKTISLRMSESEYEELKEGFTQRGIRNFSEFVRFSVDYVLGNNKKDITSQLATLVQMLARLEQEVSRLAAIIEKAASESSTRSVQGPHIDGAT